MTAFSGSIQHRGLTAANWASTNPTPLARQLCVETDTGQAKFGDGATAWNDLPYIGGTSELTTRLISGGEISLVGLVPTVAAAVYSIEGQGTFSSSSTPFSALSLSSAGTTRYVGFFGTTSGTVTKVEGTEGAAAAYPATPADTCPLGYVEVTDAGAGSGEAPAEVVFSDIGGNASDNASLVAYVLSQRYITMAYHWTTTNPSDATTYFIGTAGLGLSTSSSNSHGVAPITGTIHTVAITSRNNNATTEAVTFAISINGGLATNVTTTYVMTAGAGLIQQLITGLSIAVTAGDQVLVQMITPTWATNPTNTAGSVVLYIR